MVSTFCISGQEFTLEVSGSVFQPTSTTRKMADHLEIPPGAEVLDLGCGSGPLAIVAAKLGAGHVYAVDVMEEACKLAWENVKRNDLVHKVSIRCGSLFEPVKGQKFDVIIDDVSGVADRVARLSGWFPDPIPTGGEDGADLVVKVLADAKEYLRPGGQIYFPVLSLSRAKRIIECAQQLFHDSAKCLASYSIPFCKELTAATEELESLRKRGLIEFSKMGSRYVWTLEVWRATLSPRAPQTAQA
jgi:release factor glutamine methyltransferase